jgi:hypothetical protein
MGMFDEMKGEVLKLVLALGGILVFLGLFKLWAGTGTIGLVIAIILGAMGFGGYILWKSGNV